MDFEDPAYKKRRSEMLIADFERRARLTGNPLYIWQAILWCFVNDIALSAYLLGYIKTTAFLLWPLIEDSVSENPELTPEKALKLVAGALQMSGKQGMPNAFIRLRRDREIEKDQAREDWPTWNGLRPAHRETDPRNLRRRIAAGRKLVGMPIRTKRPPKP